MSDLSRLPTVQVPERLRARTLDRALAAESPRVPRSVADALLVAFCAGHLAWCLHAIEWL
jgi:hypothetical protein